MVTLPFIIQLRFVMWIAISALNLAFAVMLGAFGAHGLKAHASPEQLAWWQTATDYFLSCAWIVSAWYFKQGSSSFPNQVIFLAYSDWHSVLLWFALYHGIGFTADIRCDYANRWSFDDCWMANLGLECFQIRKIIGM